jgi:hypothetical protein
MIRIVVTDVERCCHAIKAIRYGADHCVERTTDSKILIRAVRSICGSDALSATTEDATVPHSVKRWADVVMKLTCSPTDPRTLNEWGRFVGVSVGGLRNWCRTAQLPARRSLVFARVLRAVMRQHGTTLAADELLNVTDRRTLGKLLELGGGASGRLPTCPEEFLERQQLIGHQRAIATVRSMLTRPPSSVSSTAPHGSETTDDRPRILAGRQTDSTRV